MKTKSVQTTFGHRNQQFGCGMYPTGSTLASLRW